MIFRWYDSYLLLSLINIIQKLLELLHILASIFNMRMARGSFWRFFFIYMIRVSLDQLHIRVSFHWLILRDFFNLRFLNRQLIFILNLLLSLSLDFEGRWFDAADFVRWLISISLARVISARWFLRDHLLILYVDRLLFAISFDDRLLSFLRLLSSTHLLLLLLLRGLPALRPTRRLATAPLLTNAFLIALIALLSLAQDARVRLIIIVIGRGVGIIFWFFSNFLGMKVGDWLRWVRLRGRTIVDDDGLILGGCKLVTRFH